MNLTSIWSVASAEMRMNRRLVRTWIFIVFTLVMCTGVLINSFFSYSMTSSVSSSTLLNSPLMIPYQLYPTVIGFFAIWVIFLAFDVRSRDKRDRLDEVVGVLPISNFELVLGRATGITVLLLIPILALIALYWLGGFIIRLGWPESGIREPELYVTLATLVFDLIPNLLFWIALVMGVTLLVRLRVIAAAIALGAVGLTYWAQNNFPVYVLNIINSYTAVTFLPSFVAPTFTTLEIVTHRTGMLFLSFAFLCLAAALYPRLDKVNRPRMFIYSGVLLVLGVLTFYIVHIQYQGEYTGRVEMANVHKPFAEQHQVDFESLNGQVQINPGGETTGTFDIDLNPVTRLAQGDEFILSLNPGYEIESLTMNGVATDYRFEQGLLAIQVDTPIGPTDTMVLSIAARGDLDPRFAYLDSAVDLLSSDIFQAFGLVFQGTYTYVNSSHYVALIPDLGWYPLPGAHYHRGLTHIRPRDFFSLDLDVVVPDDWSVAGPGQSEIETTADERRVTFMPAAPVHEVALFASEFDRRMLEIKGVEFEVMVSPQNATNLDVFEPVLDDLKSHVAEMLVQANAAGLTYPYRTFTIVETPINLRAYRGGWRMDSGQSFPGVFTIREGSFLQAGFQAPFDRLEENNEITEEERLERKLAFLTGYFKNDVTGGNVYLAAANNLMQYQTDATGPGAIPLSYIMNYLARQLTTDLEGFYSAHVTMDTSAQGMSTIGVAQISREQDGRTLSRLFYDWHIDQPDTWEAMQAQPLGQAEYADFENAKTNLHVLHLWGRSMSQLMKDWLGKDQLALLLSEMRTRYAGTTYTYDDLVAVAAELGLDITPIFGNWLEKNDFAGFLASRVETVRLPDQEYGVPLYESSFFIENPEPVPGLVTVEYGMEERSSDSEVNYDSTEPIKVPGNGAVQVSLTSEEPLQLIRVNPYLSYNRMTFSLTVPYRRNYEEVERDEQPQVQLASWQYELGDSIVVDDLDTGFTVDDGEGTGPQMPWFVRMFLSVAFSEPPKDQGLSSYGGGVVTMAFAEWSRQQLDQAYGKYRRTLARAFNRSTVANAHFAANLPTSGTWKLEYHVPPPGALSSSLRTGFGGGAVNVNFGSRRRARWGDFDVWVTDGDRVVPIEFDGESMDEGWNLLGEFDLENPLVTVSVSTETTQGAVVADAIRWTPAS